MLPGRPVSVPRHSIWQLNSANGLLTENAALQYPILTGYGLRACVEKSSTIQESRDCRAKVRERWGVDGGAP